MKKVISGLLMLISIGTILFCAFRIYQIKSEYKQGDDLYEKTLEENVDQKENAGENNNKLPIDVDFEDLLSQNPDTVGWIYCEGTVINYPVVKRDDEYYLHHLFDGTPNKNGTIFVEEMNQPLFEDQNTIIYGHHMKSGAMFASLMKYGEEDGQNYLNEHQIFWFLTPEHNYQLQVLATFTAKALDDTYNISFENQDAYAEWIKTQIGKSDVISTIPITVEDKLVTLSTCAYNFEDARYVVLAKVVEID